MPNLEPIYSCLKMSGAFSISQDSAGKSNKIHYIKRFVSHSYQCQSSVPLNVLMKRLPSGTFLEGL